MAVIVDQYLSLAIHTLCIKLRVQSLYPCWMLTQLLLCLVVSRWQHLRQTAVPECAKSHLNLEVMVNARERQRFHSVFNVILMRLKNDCPTLKSLR